MRIVPIGINAINTISKKLQVAMHRPLRPDFVKTKDDHVLPALVELSMVRRISLVIRSIVPLPMAAGNSNLNAMLKITRERYCELFRPVYDV